MDKIEAYINKHEQWKNELSLLRKWMNDTELVETLKWGVPTYTINGKNVVGIAGFKNHFALWFFQGVFLNNERGLLINAQEGKTKGLRQARFNSMEELDEQLIKAYTLEAIANQKANKEIKVERTKTVKIPLELEEAFMQDKVLKNSFEQLSPGKRKDYAEHIQSAKQEKTKLSRLQKIIPMIKAGKGLYDKYKNC